ncbi:MAG: hypothetical protein ACP5UM_10735, partial [Anaerolineae bacterium]
PPAPPWSASALVALLTGAVAALGAHGLARRQAGTSPWAWPAPFLLAACGSLLLQEAPTRLYWLSGLLGLMAWLALLLWLPASAVQGPEGQAWKGRKGLLRAATYGVAWIAFATAHTLGLPGVLVASTSAGLLSAQILSLEEGETRLWGMGAAMAWVQAAVALYLRASGVGLWAGGAVHLLLFHAGLSLQEVEGPAALLLGSIAPAIAALALLLAAASP